MGGLSMPLGSFHHITLVLYISVCYSNAIKKKDLKRNNSRHLFLFAHTKIVSLSLGTSRSVTDSRRVIFETLSANVNGRGGLFAFSLAQWWYWTTMEKTPLIELNASCKIQRENQVKIKSFGYLLWLKIRCTDIICNPMFLNRTPYNSNVTATNFTSKLAGQKCRPGRSKRLKTTECMEHTRQGSSYDSKPSFI